MNYSTISLCMIIRNEEQVLPKCLDSVVGKVDEIIIVDTGSTDSSIEIAKKYGASIYHYKWENDFSSARNISLEAATSDYILVLDADEYLDPIMNLKDYCMLDRDLYYFKLKNYQSNNTFAVHTSLRMFRNMGLRYKGRLHENIVLPISQQLTKFHVREYIHHEGYLESIITSKNKKERNFRIMNEELTNNPTAFNYFNMGKVLLANSDYKNALKMFENTMDRISNSTPPYLHNLFNYISDCYLQLEQYENGINFLLECIKFDPKYYFYYYQLGLMYKGLGNLIDAEMYFKKCLEIGERDHFLAETRQGTGSFLVRFHLAEIFEMQGDNNKALSEIINALELKPDFPLALSKYLQLTTFHHFNHEEIYNHMTTLCPIKDLESLKLLLTVLADKRHPLLRRFMSDFQIEEKLGHDIRAIGYQYNKDYLLAKEYWLKYEGLSTNVLKDVILLALVTKDISLVGNVSPVLTTMMDKQYVGKLISLDADQVDIPTPEMEKLLIYISEKLIILEEDDLFEYISGIIINNGSLQLKVDFAKLLIDFNYIDLVTPFLLSLLNQFPEEQKLIDLLAFAHLKIGDIDSALKYFEVGTTLNNSYYCYEGQYRIYRDSNNVERAGHIKDRVKKLYPTINWSLY